MTLQTFFEKFEQFVEAPDAVAKLRELVLNLAVQGKLVPQEPGDEPASKLLERISLMRSTERAGNRAAALSPLPPTTLSYDLPAQWAWAQFRDVAIIASNLVKPKEFLDFPHLAPDNIGKRNGVLFPCATVRQDKVISSNHRFFPGQIVYSKIRPNLAKVVVVDFEGLCSADMYPIDALIDTSFLQRYMLSEPFLTQAVKTDTRVAMPKINQMELNAIAVPVPPLAEQKRIVTKVDELMALCDRLEAQQKERDKRHAALARASLSRFADAPTPANLTFLFHKSYNIVPVDLRKSILALAVRGRLVPQHVDDDPANAILKRLPPNCSNVPESSDRIKDSEKPFQLPPSWKWVRLGQIANIKHGFAFSSSSFTNEPTGFVLTTPGNFHESGGFRDRGSKTKYYRGEVDPTFVFEPGDLIIPMTEQAAGLLGSPAFIPDDGRLYIHNQRLGKLNFCSNDVSPQFAFWYFNAEFFRNELARTCTGMKVRHTSPRKVLSVPFPLCSLAEQRRIVAKLDQLMPLVDELETQLAASRATAAKLLDAIVGELTA